MSSLKIPADVLSEFLDQGQWSDGGKEDLGLREQLTFAFVADLARKFRQAPHDDSASAGFGLVVLALGAAHWGVSDAPHSIADPQKDEWRGPPRGRGKHLMSVTAGGVGLPHMDTGYLGEFIEEVVAPTSNAEARDDLERLAAALKKRATFASLKVRGGHDWEVFVSNTERALGTKDGQRWVLERWLNRYWRPSLDATLAEDRDVPEAIVNARIRNSAATAANCAHAKARGAPDPVAVQLLAYVSGCPRSKKRHRTRWGYMLRPVEAFRAF
ncbi:hypothetical protein [Methylobacterium sp. R2-1]|uniref:hypothetical protein n=1 Tax=Methylobacterium sp. R2-1 TaxID=2587064 RepID=UPI00160B4E9F|nr:hypothetical protein [Methylobacterium sp. R2-1]MBB2961923.1 hypothetical protein [Methylobacterium sp. R2-1]